MRKKRTKHVAFEDDETLIDEDDQPKTKTKPKKGSMGPPDGAVDQIRRKSVAPILSSQGSQKQLYQPAELKELYADWMELCSKGKITTKNTWNLNLIDYLDEVQDVIDDPSTKEDQVAHTNFQKASATLDASVKIYSSRVDSVHTDTYKMWGGLSRTKGEKEKAQDEEKMDEDELDFQKAPTSKRPVARNAPVVTIETNVNALNMKKLDIEFFVDPLFRKTSASFDNTGARGFLLSQLSVCNGCEIIFDSGDALNGESTKFTDSEIDISALQAQAMAVCADLSFLEIDPIYKNFRFSENTKKLDRVELGGSDGEESFDDIPIDDGWDPVREEEKLAEGLGAAVLPTAGIFDHIPEQYEESQPWRDDVLNYADDETETSTQQGRKFEAALQIIEKGNDNDYNYFNSKLIETWAGPAHWKFQKNVPKRGEDDGEGEGEDGEGKPKKEKTKRVTKKRKAQFVIDFTSPNKKKKTEIAKLLEPAPKSATTFSSTVLSNQLRSASNLLLPIDVKFDPTSFTQLFNKPKWVIPTLAERARKENEPRDDDTPGQGWGRQDDDFDQDDDLDQNVMDVHLNIENVGEFDGPLNLIPMPERHEKISVKFATNATFVDVKALKNKLWKQIATTQVSTAKTDRSFREVVESTNRSVPEHVRESVSIPYYFICLLHLANEHNLEIQQYKNSDLKIIVPKKKK